MGLIGGMARTAVVAGTATAVSNRVSRRQAGRWQEKDQQQYEHEAYEQQQQQQAYAQQQQQYAQPQYAPQPQYAAPAHRHRHRRPPARRTGSRSCSSWRSSRPRASSRTPSSSSRRPRSWRRERWAGTLLTTLSGSADDVLVGQEGPGCRVLAT